MQWKQWVYSQWSIGHYFEVCLKAAMLESEQLILVTLKFEFVLSSDSDELAVMGWIVVVAHSKWWCCCRANVISFLFFNSKKNQNMWIPKTAHYFDLFCAVKERAGLTLLAHFYLSSLVASSVKQQAGWGAIWNRTISVCFGQHLQFWTLVFSL